MSSAGHSRNRSRSAACRLSATFASSSAPRGRRHHGQAELEETSGCEPRRTGQRRSNGAEESRHGPHVRCPSRRLGGAASRGRTGADGLFVGRPDPGRLAGIAAPVLSSGHRRPVVRSRHRGPGFELAARDVRRTFLHSPFFHSPFLRRVRRLRDRAAQRGADGRRSRSRPVLLPAGLHQHLRHPLHADGLPRRLLRGRRRRPVRQPRPTQRDPAPQHGHTAAARHRLRPAARQQRHRRLLPERMPTHLGRRPAHLPPDQKAALFLPWKTEHCAGPTIHSFTIGPIQG